MKNFFLFALCAIILLIAFNKPSDFGKELVSDSNIPFEVLDTFSLNVVSERSDSLRTYVPGAVSLTMSNSIIGYLDDPDFGSIKAEAYAGFAVERILKDSLTYMQIDSASIRRKAAAINPATHNHRHFGGSLFVMFQSKTYFIFLNDCAKDNIFHFVNPNIFTPA